MRQRLAGSGGHEKGTSTPKAKIRKSPVAQKSSQKLKDEDNDGNTIISSSNSGGSNNKVKISKNNSYGSKGNNNSIKESWEIEQRSTVPDSDGILSDITLRNDILYDYHDKYNNKLTHHNHQPMTDSHFASMQHEYYNSGHYYYQANSNSSVISFFGANSDFGHENNNNNSSNTASYHDDSINYTALDTQQKHHHHRLPPLQLYNKSRRKNGLAGGVHITRNCCLSFCSGFSLVAFFFLLWVAIMLDKQPLYIKGVLMKQIVRIDDVATFSVQYSIPKTERLPTAIVAYKAAFAYLIVSLATYLATKPVWSYMQHRRFYRTLLDDVNYKRYHYNNISANHGGDSEVLPLHYASNYTQQYSQRPFIRKVCQTMAYLQHCIILCCSYCHCYHCCRRFTSTTAAIATFRSRKCTVKDW